MLTFRSVCLVLSGACFLVSAVHSEDPNWRKLISAGLTLFILSMVQL